MTDSVTYNLESLAKGVWWLVLLRGILAIVFGVIALLAPVAALTGVAIVYGAYALVDGIFTITQAVRERKRLKAWGWLLFQGVVAVIAGILVLIVPTFAGAVGALFLLWLVVVWNVIHGVAGIRSAAGAEDGRAKTWGIIAGVASILLAVLIAVLIFAVPGATLYGVIWAVGIWAILFGIMLVVMAIQVRMVWRNASSTTPKMA
jgi:uncharacterized membrane protein HdeD (DUF308 family)